MDSIRYEAIKIAFMDDLDIGDNCDPSNDDKSQEGVVNDVYRKIAEYEEVFYGRFAVLTNGGEEAGFVYCLPELLVSFGVNKKHRTKEFLPVVFDIICEMAGDNFEAYMWERNKRAVEWLKKCGMQEEYFENKEIKKLRYDASNDRSYSGGRGNLVSGC